MSTSPLTSATRARRDPMNTTCTDVVTSSRNFRFNLKHENNVKGCVILQERLSTWTTLAGVTLHPKLYASFRSCYTISRFILVLALLLCWTLKFTFWRHAAVAIVKPSTHIRVFDARQRDATRPSRATEVTPYTRFSSDRRSGASHLLTCFMFFHEKSPLHAQIRLKIWHPASQTAVWFLNYLRVLARPDQNSLQPATKRVVARRRSTSRDVTRIWVRVHCILPNRFFRSRRYAWKRVYGFLASRVLTHRALMTFKIDFCFSVLTST